MKKDWPLTVTVTNGPLKLVSRVSLNVLPIIHIGAKPDEGYGSNIIISEPRLSQGQKTQCFGNVSLLKLIFRALKPNFDPLNLVQNQQNMARISSPGKKVYACLY